MPSRTSAASRSRRCRRPCAPAAWGCARSRLPVQGERSPMRHAKKKGKLSRDAAHRRSLLRTMSKQLIEHERIQTTQPKAKALRPEFEKLITLAKRGDLHARRQALSQLNQDKFAVHKLFEEIAPRYVDRNGGYTPLVQPRPPPPGAAGMGFLRLVFTPVLW